MMISSVHKPPIFSDSCLDQQAFPLHALPGKKNKNQIEISPSLGSIHLPFIELDARNFLQQKTDKEEPVAKIRFFEGRKIVLVKADGEEVDLPSHFNGLPTLSSAYMAETYLENTFIHLHRFSEGGYRLEAKTRGLGGGKTTALHKAVAKGDSKKVKKIIDTVVTKKNDTPSMLRIKTISPLSY